MSDFMEEVNKLRKRGPADLTDAEKAFLAARRSYLTQDERVMFGLTDEETQEGTADDGEAKPAKKAKKAKADDGEASL